MTASLSDLADARARTWVRLAVVYFFAAVGLGIVMGVSGNHRMMPVHAHLNLLGWVSMALFGAIARAVPATARGRLADVHFVLYSIAVPLMLGALAAESGGLHAGPLIGIGSLGVGLAVLVYASQVLRVLTRATPRPAVAEV